MKCQHINIFLLACIVALLSACATRPENAQPVSHTPHIFPDYVDVTIPVGIAPMNFAIDTDPTDEREIYVVAKGTKGGEMECGGTYTDFDVDDWHELTEQNKGGDIIFTVYEKKDGQWLQYKDFPMHVSRYELDAYGITYRRIPPGYEVGGDIGVYQRDLHCFNEEPLVEMKAIPGQCVNCHTPNRTKGDEFLMHVRGTQGGTLVQQNGKQTWLNTKTDSTKANMGYSYWHPSGRYIASSVNSIHQAFFVGKERRIEVFDLFSDVLVYDIEKNELLLSPLLQTSDWETYPVFNAAGDTIYFSTSKPCEVPKEYQKAQYSLCKIAFNANDGTFGTQVDTIFSASATNKSYTFPRPSYDGRWLMYGVTHSSNFPVNRKEADLWLLDLRRGVSRPLTEVNSDDADSFHNWSADSHWFVFSSRRGDTMYSLTYFSSIDDNGRCTKPFLLPQRNPLLFYASLLDSFNCPDFIQQRVNLDAHEASKTVLSGERKQVTIRE